MAKVIGRFMFETYEDALKDFKNLRRCSDNSYSINVSHSINVAHELVRLATNIQQIRTLMKDYAWINEDYKEAAKIFTLRYLDFLNLDARRAKSFDELYQLVYVIHNDRNSPVLEINEWLKRVLRRLIPLSDNQREAYKVLCLTRDGSVEERRAFERVIRFSGTSLWALRCLLNRTRLDSSLEAMVLKLYMAELKKSKG